MSKRSFSESFDDSDSDQEELIVEELEKWRNKLKILRKNKSKGCASTATSSQSCEQIKNEEILSLPSTSFNSSWFESEDFDFNKENIEEITIELEEGEGVPEGLVVSSETSPKSTSDEVEREIIPLDPQVEALLGKEGLTESKNDNIFHASVANKWSFILVKGLSEEINQSLVSKYVPPSNCMAIVPPDLNPEIKNNLKKEALTRDDRQKSTQRQLSTILSALGQALTRLLNASSLTKEDILLLIESLSDAGRLLADVHYKTSTHRRYLILGMGFEHKIKNNIKDVLFNAPIDGLLFGRDLSAGLDKAKALERNSLSILDSSNKFQRPNLNVKGLSLNQRVNRTIQKRRDGPPSRYNRPSQQPARAQQQFKVPRPFTGRQEKKDYRRY